MALLRRSLRPPPIQGALHVQHLPVARAVGKNCTCVGPQPSRAFHNAFSHTLMIHRCPEPRDGDH
eukprot:12544895-Alexandrium_andersonii.AAC.1